MAYQFGSTSFPAYSSFGGLSSFGGYAAPSTTFGSVAPSAFAPTAYAPTAFGSFPAATSGFSTSGFPTSALPTSAWGGVSGYGSAVTPAYANSFAAPAAFGNSGFAPTAFGTSAPWATGAQWGFAPGQALQAAQPGQEGPLAANGARARTASNIAFGPLGVPTMVSNKEEGLTKPPSSGNLPVRTASKGELATRSRSFTTGNQVPQDAMASYLTQNCAVDPRVARAIGGSAFQARNLGAPTGHRGSNPRDVVPF